MEELWAAIDGFVGYYEVSTLGRVRSLDRSVPRRNGRTMRLRGRVLRPGIDSEGYLSVTLSMNCKVMRKIHRLVAAAFLPPSTLPHVNHNDFDRANNAAANLSWTTPSGNQQHASANGRLRASNNPKNAKKLSAAAVVQIREARVRGDSFRAIGLAFGVAHTTARQIIVGNIW